MKQYWHDDAVPVDRAAKMRRIASMLSSQHLHLVYQPAIRLDRPGVEFVEALARFDAEPFESPDLWFKTAAEVGLGTDLELLAIRLALAGFRSLPSAASMSVNLSPRTILHADFCDLLTSAPVDRLILEVTEHEPVSCYESVRKQLQNLRKRGLRLAVDDAGAGYSNFRHILELRPELIKLDVSLARGICTDPIRRALASALIGFAREIGSDLVAEGVETFSELRCLRDRGVNIVQGHVVSHPGSCADIWRRSADFPAIGVTD